MIESNRPADSLPAVVIDAQSLTIEDIVKGARHNAKVVLAPQAVANIKKGEEAVKKVIQQERIVYGVTTGFGAFSDKVVLPDEVKKLQRNLIISHAIGVGEPFSEEIVRAIMLLRANTLASGHCGIRLRTVQTLIDMLNAGVHPYIRQKGSVGASGDLVPLAHLTLVLIGEGQAYYRGRLLRGAEAMKKAGIEPIELDAKEGLALINGTQVMTAIAAMTVYDAEVLVKTADIVAAMTIDALKGVDKAFDERIHLLRPHPGQIKSAANLRTLLQGRDTAVPDRGQDAYSLRCTPPVHGASRDTLEHVRKVVTVECNSVTDNPLVFPETEEFLSCGNFHGQPIAVAMDLLAICLCEIANISERRIDRLINPMVRQHLPGFLIEQGGINSGFMITQYTAAALVSENKVLAHPASVDSIPTSGNQEDHVSMGTISARKAREIKDNVEHVLAIEMLCAGQALDFLRETPLGRGVKVIHQTMRKKVPYLAEDKVMYPHMDMVREMIRSGEILQAVENQIGRLQ
ncbi:MAG: histidine ammonia-lyase [Phycisphaerae bacterium SM23_30]|nr:MAG: histidine ammonia-lyase [Phycisphaerae bacterium SM23_30]